MQLYDIFLHARAKENLCLNIQQAQTQLWSQVCTHLPFLHPLLGCDKASRVQGIGKGVCIKKLSPSYFVDQARCLIVILTPKDEAKDEVISAEEKALVCIYIYNGKEGETLYEICDRVLCETVSKSTIFCGTK